MASGDTLLIFTPQANEPPSSNYATMDTRNSHLVLDFDGASNEDAVFSGVMPQHYDGGGVSVYIHYAMSSATSGADAQTLPSRSCTQYLSPVFMSKQ